MPLDASAGPTKYGIRQAREALRPGALEEELRTLKRRLAQQEDEIKKLKLIAAKRQVDIFALGEQLIKGDQ
jgi:hypothetical protein